MNRYMSYLDMPMKSLKWSSSASNDSENGLVGNRKAVALRGLQGANLTVFTDLDILGLWQDIIPRGLWIFRYYVAGSPRKETKGGDTVAIRARDYLT